MKMLLVITVRDYNYYDKNVCVFHIFIVQSLRQTVGSVICVLVTIPSISAFIFGVGFQAFSFSEME